MEQDDLDSRLAAMEARIPVQVGPPDLEGAPRGRRRRGMTLVVAPILVLALGATALAASTITGLLVRGAPGIENPGQPLYGANMECMTPPQAAAYLAAHGYTDVVWQIETATKDQAGGAEAPPVKVTTPPTHGYVVPGALVDGQLLMVIDQRPGATGVGACFGMPMP